MASRIRNLAVDPPLLQDASYVFDTADRSYIDDQARSGQQHLVDSLLSGLHSTWYTLDAGSVAIAVGDWVCLSGSAVLTVTKAVAAALTGAGSVIGCAMTAATPGGLVRVALGGALPATVTGLGTTAGLVRINTTTARAEKVSSYSGTDYAVGTVGANGMMTIHVLSAPGVEAVGYVAGGASPPNFGLVRQQFAGGTSFVFLATGKTSDGLTTTSILSVYGDSEIVLGDTVNFPSVGLWASTSLRSVAPYHSFCNTAGTESARITASALGYSGGLNGALTLASDVHFLYGANPATGAGSYHRWSMTAASVNYFLTSRTSSGGLEYSLLATTNNTDFTVGDANLPNVQTFAATAIVQNSALHLWKSGAGVEAMRLTPATNQILLAPGSSIAVNATALPSSGLLRMQLVGGTSFTAYATARDSANTKDIFVLGAFGDGEILIGDSVNVATASLWAATNTRTVSPYHAFCSTAGTEFSRIFNGTDAGLLFSSSVSSTALVGTFGNTPLYLYSNNTAIAVVDSAKFRTLKGRAGVVLSKSANYTILVSDEIINVAGTSGAVTMTLPASPTAGDTYTIMDGDAGAAARNITVDGNGKNILDDTSAATKIMQSNGDSMTVMYNGTLWKVI